MIHQSTGPVYLFEHHRHRILDIHDDAELGTEHICDTGLFEASSAESSRKITAYRRRPRMYRHLFTEVVDTGETVLLPLVTMARRLVIWCL